jgi:ankyrin repeat protein
MVEQSPVLAQMRLGDTSPLMAAVVAGDKAAVASLLAAGAPVDAGTFPAAVTPLHQALFAGHSAIAEVLLYHRASLNMPTKTGQTPLHLAVLGQEPDLLRKMLLLGAQPELVNETGAAPLHLAVLSGSDEMVRVLLHFGADPTQPYQGMNCLELAIARGQPRAIAPLVGLLQVPDKAGLLPVHQAASSNSPGALQALLAAGADPAIEDSRGRSVLSHALTQGAVAVLPVLLPHVPLDDHYALHLATMMEENVPLFATLLAANPNVNLCDSLGRTPLYLACLLSRLEYVNLLLIRGADVNVATPQGNTPLHAALTNNFPWQTVFRLLYYGANWDAVDSAGKSCLDIASPACAEQITLYKHTYLQAAAQGHVGRIQELCRRPRSFSDSREGTFTPGLQPGLLCVTGRALWPRFGLTPLHYGFLGGHAAVAEDLAPGHPFGPFVLSLLGKTPVRLDEAALNTADLAGWTPLHFAVTRLDVGLVRLLLSRGARPDAQDVNGFTPWVLALLLHSPTLLSVLQAPSPAKQLNLSALGLDFLPWGIAKAFPALQQLDLAGNSLQNLPGSLASLKLTQLVLRDNPGLPQGLRDLPVAQQLAWLRDREATTVRPRETKLLLLGEAGVGKTSLVDALLRGKKTRASKNVSTNGIAITTFKASWAGQTALRCYDFGGQVRASGDSPTGNILSHTRVFSLQPGGLLGPGEPGPPGH